MEEIKETNQEVKEEKKEFKLGDTFKDTYPPEAAIFCNKAGDKHIEKQDRQYIIVANAPIPEPTLEEQVAKLEAETGLTRVMREMVLSENSGASDYIKAKANEIEDLAKQLRTTDETSETETVDNTQNDEYNSLGDTKQ